MKKIIIALMLIGTLGYTANRITTADMTSTGPDANKFLRSNGVAAPSWEDVPTIISDYIAEIASIAAGEGVRNQDSAANPTAIIGYGESATYAIPADSAMYFNDIANASLYAFSKAVSSGTSGSVNFLSGVATAGADSGAVNLFSGPVASGAGNSGAVNIFTGTVGAGTRGDVNITGQNIIANGNVQMSSYANGFAYFDGSGNISAVPGATDAVTKVINQVAHGLAVGDVIRYNGTSYLEADASADATAEVYGVVSAVADVDNFTVTTHGYITGLSGLTSGVAHYLSETAGALTATAPTTTGTVSKPVLLADSTTSGYVMIQRGFVNGSSGGGGSGSMKAYFQGYHDDDCRWTTTTTGAWIDLGDSSCTFVQSSQKSTGFPTVSSTTDGDGHTGTTEYPGVTYVADANTSGDVEVCALVEHNSSAAAFYGLSLYDSNSGLRKGHVNRRQGTTNNTSDNTQICAIYPVSSGQRLNARIMAYLDAAQTVSMPYSVGSYSGGQQSIQWTIKVYEQQEIYEVIFNFITTD